MTFAELSVHLLGLPFIFVLLSSIFITFKTGFIQLRTLPIMFRLLWKSLTDRTSTKGVKTIPAHKALFTAMSTTMGITNIVGPAVVVRMAGPGALVGFILATFFGAATTFVEVVFAMNYRKKKKNGLYAGGPMQYLQDELGRVYALLYGFFGALLLIIWSSNQSNTLADILSTHHIPHVFTGFVITSLVLYFLIGGIKSIGNLASTIVPCMFVMFCASSLYIVIANASQLPHVLSLMFKSFFSFETAAGATVAMSLQKMMRWGLAKGIQAGESGIGTATIPHSESTNQNAYEQGLLSIISVLTVGFVCTLTGLVVMVTGIWSDASIPMGINMIAQAFAMHFPYSSIILSASVFLFALGTILGNAYNGSQCYLYLTNQRWINWYYLVVGIVVFLGTIIDVEFVWTLSDFFIVPVAMVNLAGIMYLIFKRPELLKKPINNR